MRKQTIFNYLLVIALLVFAVPSLVKAAEVEPVCKVGNAWFIKYSAVDSKTGDLRHFLVPAGGFGNPPDADEFVSLYDYTRKIGRPGLGDIPNNGAGGDGKIEEGDNLCGSKHNGLLPGSGGAYISDPLYTCNGNNRTYVGVQINFVRGTEKPVQRDVFVQLDPDAVPIEAAVPNGRSLETWILLDDNDPS